MPQGPQYASTDPNFGASTSTSGPQYASQDPSFGMGTAASHVAQGPSGSDQPVNQPSWLGPIVNYLGEALSSLSPKNINAGVQSLNPFTLSADGTWTPIDTLSKLGKAQGGLAQKADAAFKRGDYAEGVRHAIDYALPFIGPRLDQAGDLMQQGQYAKGMGAATDVGLQIGGPAALNALRDARIPAIAGNANPVERAAVEFGQREGIPIDAGTATGSPLVKTLQKRAGDAMGGAGVAERAKAAQAQALAKTGDQLAARAFPGAEVNPEQAGQAVKDSVLAAVKDYDAKATTSYDTLRAIESDPKNLRSVQVGMNGSTPVMQDMALPVDLRDAKSALVPMYQQLKRESELVPLMGDKARALTALDRLVGGPDYAPLSVVDGALSTLKGMARADIPELRSVGQGVAAGAVKRLDALVRQTAADAGPEAAAALKAGREATIAKHQVGDVLQSLADEPVAVFNKATWAKDAGIDQLRAIANAAPDSLPKIGRAYLSDLMDTATAEGGFDKAASLQAKWQKLGPQTKQLLFEDPAYISDLDNFFLLAKKMAENPNPSGTARVMTAFNLMATLPNYALAKALYSPTGVQLLTKGLTVPLANRAAATAAAVDLANFVGVPNWTPAPVLGSDQVQRGGSR